MPSVNIKQLLADAINRGIAVFTGGRENVEYSQLTEAEVSAIEDCIKMGYSLLSKVAPDIAKDFYEHLEVFIKFGGVAKALFDNKPISFPSEPGTIGVNILFPQAIKYVATPTTNAEAYTDYKTNSWEMDVTAGTPAWILGDGTNYYKASNQTNKRELFVVMQHGVIEVGPTPSIDQFIIKTQINQKYGIYTAHPLSDQPVVEGKPIYRYPTLGVIPVYPDLGIMWGYMPRKTNTVSLRLLGVVFYEHDLFPNLTWVS